MCDQRQAEAFENEFRRILKSFRTSEGQICGYCSSADEVERLLDNLKCMGFAYVVRNSSRSQHDGKERIFFQQQNGNFHITFFGPAFTVESICHRQCILGPKYFKKKEIAVPDHLEDHVNPRKKRFLIMDTRKSNCPCTLSIKCIRVFPGYAVQSVNENFVTKLKVIGRLRKDLESQNKPESYLRYYVVASPATEHIHSTESVKVCGDIHPLLLKEIQNLVQSGTSSVNVIKLTLDRVVSNHFAGGNMPDRMNSIFYPSDKTIYNHVYKALYQIKKPVFDQTNVQNLVTQLCEESGEDNVFFRPFNGEMQNGEVQSLLFCYQNSWQRDLLKKYGDSCLLDATYKTTKYDIPLFFITVRSNVSYLVVGFFFIQVENTKSIYEALTIFKKWYSDWNPRYWVTDFSESEINAIMQLFPRTNVYLCSFHREQAWQRWLKKGGNLTSPDDKALILDLWRYISVSPTEEIFESRREELKSHDVFLRNPKVLRYFENQWLSEAQRWVKAFENQGTFANIYTTNGVEALNRMVKHCFLKLSADKTLTGVIQVLIKSFLPKLIRTYCLKNSAVKRYNSDVPLFLHKKTQKFMKHVMQRYSSAETEFTETSAVTVMGEGLFLVKSSQSNNCNYTVNFSKPSCTCADFVKYRYPCKHFCAVFILYPEWGFEKLEEGYRNSPLICLDEAYGFGLSRSLSALNSVVVRSHETSDEAETDEEYCFPETSGCRSQQQELRERCKHISNLSYNCSSSESLQEGLMLLSKCAHGLQMSNPEADGLPLAMPSTSKQ